VLLDNLFKKVEFSFLELLTKMTTLLNEYETFVESQEYNNIYMSRLSADRNITPNFIERHLDWLWDVDVLSYNASITGEFIEQHLDWKWNIKYLSINPAITPAFIERHLDWDWDMNGLSTKSSITCAFIEHHLDWKWNMYYLSRNPAITGAFVARHPEMNWDMGSLRNDVIIKMLKIRRMQIFTHGVIDNKSTTQSFFSNTMYDRHLLGIINQYL
jgi:hypothetical protein